MTRNKQPEGCQPMTCEDDSKHEGAQGVNGRGTQPLKLSSAQQPTRSAISGEAEP